MLRFLLPFITALTACVQPPALAQTTREISVGAVLAIPGSSDSIRLWHRHVNDSTLSVLVPGEWNSWLARGYEFLIPLDDRSRRPVTLIASLPHPDSLTLSCSTIDYFCSGFRLFFSRESGGFGIYRAADFQIFRSGIERICEVPLRIRQTAERTQVSPGRGKSPCWYIYQRQLLVSFPETVYRLP